VKVNVYAFVEEQLKNCTLYLFNIQATKIIIENTLGRFLLNLY